MHAKLATRGIVLSGRPTYVEWMSAGAKARSGSVLQGKDC